MGAALYPEIAKLQDAVDRRLKLSERTRPGRGTPYATTHRLVEPSCPAGSRCLVDDFTDEVLTRFDAEFFPKLMQEYKALSGGSGNVSDSAVPASWQRTVIREALYQINSLQFVDASTTAFAPSVSIPYSYRDTTAAGRADSRVYEGGEIPLAGVIQTAELAYPIPQKCSFEVSDELRHIAEAKAIDYDPIAESMSNMSRIIAEDTHYLIMNELIHASDEHGSVSVVAENLEPQADGAKRVFLLSNFPVVRPRRIFDLQGTQIGSDNNPIVVSYNGIEIQEFDGSGGQTPGNYYVLDYDVGEIYLTDETGDPIIPADGTAYTISYSYATNAYAFDTDEGSASIEDHMDALLYRLALRKCLIEDTRHYQANFGLMSGNVSTMVGQAKKFSANFKVPGTDLLATGDIGLIKNIPFSKTSGLGLWFRDRRILLGQRGVTRLRMMKPWRVTSLVNQTGPNGRFTGKKAAYGDQWIALHTPTQLKGAYTSIVLYSSSSRVARVNP